MISDTHTQDVLAYGLVIKEQCMFILVKVKNRYVELSFKLKNSSKVCLNWNSGEDIPNMMNIIL